MLRVIGRIQKKEKSKRSGQKVKKKVEKDLEKGLKKLKVEKNEIDKEDMLKSN